MRRREFIAGLGATVLPVTARAQHGERAWRIRREQFELLQVSAPTPTAIGLAIPAALEFCNCSCIGSNPPI